MNSVNLEAEAGLARFGKQHGRPPLMSSATSATDDYSDDFLDELAEIADELEDELQFKYKPPAPAIVASEEENDDEVEEIDSSETGFPFEEIE